MALGKHTKSRPQISLHSQQYSTTFTSLTNVKIIQKVMPIICYMFGTAISALEGFVFNVPGQLFVNMHTL